MALTPGTRFGQYEIAEPIGSGGMGEVYRATDTTLERDVAIKVLPASFASDTDRVARFEREAKTLATLNHANIAQVFGLERADGTTAIVMELVEGPTLADRIEQGPVPADEALNIAMQIADALEAAHTQGIVHRDLKPANIKLKADGTVKVLDFGIAKAFEPESISSGPQAPSLTTPAMTQAGIILGTAAYMSPEQAKGKAVDQRADIWAFGVVLYEMLTGQPAFGGDDVPETLARVIAYGADIDTLPKTIAPAVRHAIGLCLEKDLRKRIADIRDVRLALEGAFESVPGQAEATVPAARPAWRRALGHAASLALGAALVAAGAWSFWPASQLRSVNRFDFELPESQSFRNAGRPVMALSPDGRRFVYNTGQGLYLREMGQLEARLIPGTEEGLTNPFFSPDGQSIAYFAEGQLKRIAISGGAPVVIASGLNNPFGGSWEEDGTILLGQTEGIVRVSANGGTPELVIEARDGERLHGPELLPDGETVLFSAVQTANWDTAQIVAQSLATGERTEVLTGGSDAHYLPTGHLVYALGDGLLGIEFDVERLSVSGGPAPLVQGLTRAAGGFTAAANYGVANDGTLVYVRSGDFAGDLATLVWVDRAEEQEPVGIGSCACIDLAISPDGTRVAITELSLQTGESDIWIWSFESATKTRLTFEPGFQIVPVWTPDSERIAYVSVGQGFFWRDADGTGAVEPLLESTANPPWIPYVLNGDGQLVFSETGDNSGGPGIGLLSVAGDGEPETYLSTDFVEARPALSPDGRWLAYESDETGQLEVYVRPFPDAESGKWQVSAGGGAQPLWAADGGALHFVGPTHLMEAGIETEPTFRRQTPEAIIDLGSYLGRNSPRGYAVSADGERFLVIQPAAGVTDGARPRFIIVEHWLDELGRLVPTE